MRLAFLIVSILAVSGCKTSAQYQAKQYAEIATETAPGCSQPTVRFRELRDQTSRNVLEQQTPLLVPPGIYTIGLSCGSIMNDELQRCVDTHEDEPESEVPSYDLIVRPKVRYLFSCIRVNGVLTFTMVETKR